MSTILTLHDPQVARAFYAEGHWREDTLYTLLRQHATTRPDAYALRDSVLDVLEAPASAVVSGLPLVTKPMLTRLKLIRDAFMALAPGAPFVQFTYNAVPPIPKRLERVPCRAGFRPIRRPIARKISSGVMGVFTRYARAL